MDKTSGLITTHSEFDYENTTIYQFEVTVSDGINNDTADITVDIRNMNDNAPVFSAKRYKVDIPENITNQPIERNVSLTSYILSQK